MKKIIFVGLFPPVINGQSLVNQKVLDIIERRYNVITLKLIDGSSNFFSKILFYFILNIKFIFKAGISTKIIYINGTRSVSGFLRNFFIIFWSKIFKHKLIVHFHTGDVDQYLKSKPFYIRNIFSNYYSKANKLIILGKGLMDNFKSFDSKKVHIIPNGIETNDLDINKPNDKFNIIFLSNLIESKGYFDLLKSIDILVNEYKIKNIKCVFCGEFLSTKNDSFKNVNQAKFFFNNYILEKQLQNNVKYLGLVSGKSKSNLLKKSHLFVLPTEYPIEAQPLSILEAMSFGCVVLSTNYRSIPDMIMDRKTGLIIKKSALDIASKIKELYNNNDFANFLRNNAKDHVSNNFSKKIFESNLISLFDEI